MRKLPGYYSCGEFAKLAHITKKTLRYYDEHNILRPSLVTESKARYYTDKDFARLQQILLLKSLGFSLDDVREMTIGDTDDHFMIDSLNLQLKLVEDRIEQMRVIAQTIRNTSLAIQHDKEVDWSQMLELIRLTGMEKSLKNQYLNASNIASRINLHSKYSQNSYGWFPWIFDQCDLKNGMDVLEIGCGDGTLWRENLERVPDGAKMILSDVSEGMLRDARRSLLEGDTSHLRGRKNASGTGDISTDQEASFSFRAFDCHKIPYDGQSFDRIIANHVLFYCEDISMVCKEVVRTLKPGGVFICSAYGAEHMKEISQLVSDFDDRIILAAQSLYERFGRENGAELLAPYFSEVTWVPYEDELIVPDPEALISYVLSCHGNQNQYIVDHYKEFRNFVRKKTEGGFHITKDAGVFVCKAGDV